MNPNLGSSLKLLGPAGFSTLRRLNEAMILLAEGGGVKACLCCLYELRMRDKFRIAPPRSALLYPYRAGARRLTAHML